MTNGIILSNFDEHKGFIPVLYVSSLTDNSVIKDIVFRSTLNLVGGTKNISEERETFIDFPDHQLIGCSYLRSAESSSIRGGLMPIILILFTSSENRVYVYQNLLQIMSDLKILMTKVIANWKDTKFSNLGTIRTLFSEFKIQFEKGLVEATSDTIETQSTKFIVECPECSQEVPVLVPKKIPDLLTIPITDSPCRHSFEAYFTKGPVFRGTSKQFSGKRANDGLKDIFNSL